MVAVWLVALFTLFVLTGTSSGQLLVQTTSGPVSGFSVSSSVNAWLGIPYATPPTGNLRWTQSTPPTPWTSTFSATEFGNSCIQLTSQSTFTAGPAQTFSEDCLTINVWAPSTGGNHSVMVWIHGGFLISGGSGETVYNGANFASQGVVLVSFNYRLGNIGFLALNELSGVANGAYGFLDQQLALQWVNQNIAAFGGNPNQVTIFGESAGCGSVALHLTTKSSWTYFQQAILQSCPAFSESNPLQYQIEAGEIVVNDNGCKNSDASTVLSCMRNLPATTFAVGSGQRPPMVAAASGQIVDLTQYQAIQIGRLHPGPIMGGDVANEGTIFVYATYTSPMSSRTYQNKFPSFLWDFMGITPNDGTAMVNQYACSNYDSSDCRVAASALLGDLRYRCPTDALLQAYLSVSDSTAYAYMDNDVPSYALAGLGAYHGSELPFVFNTLQSIESSYTPAEVTLASDMNTAWVNFAMNGKPSVSDQPSWPVYTSAKTRMIINTGTWSNTGSTADCSFFTSYYAAYYTNGIPDSAFRISFSFAIVLGLVLLSLMFRF